MSTVDNRVVKMTFDNGQFEKNLKTTMESLSKFEQSLKLDGATAGFDALKQATDKLNLSVLGDKADKEAQRIDQMSSEARKSIDSIDDAASNADFSALSNAAGDAVDGVNTAIESTDFSSMSDSAMDTAIDINNAASTVDLSSISDSANEASNSFSALEVVATGVLLGIGEKISGLVTGGLSSMGRKIKEYTIDPMVDGFKEYETQMGSIQTIMANTGMNFNSDKDIATVNAALDELNTYADKTIYNFTEMTKNIGTFTAAGIELEPATKAIQGIANLAALSGSNSQQASTAMYQLSQALSTGSLKLQDWNSVVNAGMGGKVFQEALKETARVHHVAVDEMIEDAGSFRESLSMGWISSEILTETLNHMAISYEKVGDASYDAAMEQLRQEGYTKEQAEAILDLAKRAEESATKVRTWTQLWDTVKEAIGSQWSSIFRNLIGDFKQATDTFTFMSKNISNGVEALLGGLVHAAERFNKSGGITAIFGGYKRDKEGNDIFDDETNELVRIKGAIDYLAEAIAKPLGAIKDAFDSIFGMDDKQLDLTIVSMALAFKDFAQSLVISDNAATGLRHIFEGLFSIFDIGLHIVMDLGAAFFGVINVLRIFIDPLIDIALVLGGQVGKVITWVHDILLDLRAAVIYAITPITDLISAFGDFIKTAFGFADIPGKIESVGDMLITVLDVLWEFIDIPGKIGLIGDALRGIFGFIGDLTGWNSAVSEANKLTEKTGEHVSALDIWLSKLLDNPVGSFIKSIISGIKQIWASISNIKSGFDAEGAVNHLGIIRKEFGKIGEVFGSVGKAASKFAGIMGSILSPAFNTIFDFIKTIGTGIGSVALASIGGMVAIFTSLGKALGVVGSSIKTVLSSEFSILIKDFIELGSAVKGLAERLWDFFLAWEPIKNVIALASEFKTKVVDFFIGIPNSISGAGEKLSKSIIGANSFGSINDWLSRTIETIKNLSAQDFVNMISEFFGNMAVAIPKAIESIRNKVSEAMTLILSIDKKTVHAAIYNTTEALQQWVEGLAYTLQLIAWAAMPSGLAFIISTAIDAIKKPITGALEWIKSISWWAESHSNNIIEYVLLFFVTLTYTVVTKIKDFIKDVAIYIAFIGISLVGAVKNVGKLIIDSISAIFNGKGLSGVLKALSDFKNNMLSYLKGAFSNFGPEFEGIYDSIVSFFNGLPKDMGRLKELLGPIFDSIKVEFEKLGPILQKAFRKTKRVVINFVKDIPRIMSNAMNTFKNTLSSAVEAIVDRLATFSGPVGEFFSVISDRIHTTEKETKKASKKIPTNIASITDTIKEKIKDLWKSLKEFFVGSEDSEEGGIVDRILRFLGGKAGDLTEKIIELPKNIGEFFSNIADHITPETVDKVVKIVGIIAKVKLMRSLRKLFSGLGALSKAFARRMNKQDNQTIDERMRSWAITFAVIAGALWVISTIPNPWEALGVLAGVSAVLVASTSISAFVQKKFDKSGGDDMLKAAAGLAILAFAIRELLKTVEILNGFNYEKNKTGLIALGGFLLLFAGWTRLLGDGGKNAIQAAAGLLIMSIALRMLLGPIKEITEFSKTLKEEEMLNAIDALVAIGLFIVALGAAMQLAGEHPLAAGAGFLLMAASISIIADAIEKISALASLDVRAVLVSFGGIAVLIGEYAALAKLAKPTELLAAGASLVLFSASITIISDAISKLSMIATFNPDGVKTSFDGMIGLVAIFGALASFVKPTELLAASAAMVVLSAAVAIIAYSMRPLASVDSGALTAAGIAIAAIIGVFGILVAVLSMPALSDGAVTVLPMLALALISLGAACFLIGTGLEHAVTGIVALAMASPILQAFVTMISANVGNFLLAAVGIGALGAAFAIFGPTALIAGAGIWLLANGIRDLLMLIIQLPVLLPAAGESLSTLFGMIVERAGGLIPQLAEWWSGTAWPFLVEKFDEFKTWFSTNALPILSNLLSSIIAKAREFIANLHAWWDANGPTIMAKAGEFITNLLGKIGEVVPKLGAWVLNTGIPMAAKAVSDIFGKAKETLGPKASEFIHSIPEKLSSAVAFIGGTLSGIGRNIAEGIAAGISNAPQVITNALSTLCANGLDYVKKFFGIASPSKLMRDEVGRYIPEGVASGIISFAGVVNEAIKNLALHSINGVDDILSKADYSLPSPSISPVMNMSSLSNDISDYNNLLGNMMTNGNIRLNNGLTGEMSLSADLASKLDADMNGMDNLTSTVHDIQDALYNNIAKTEELYGQTNAILYALSGDASSIRNSLSNGMNLYVDKGTLVGAIVPEVDAALGRRAVLAGRGVY